MTGGLGADIVLFKAGHRGSYENLADTILDSSQDDGGIIDLPQIDAIADGVTMPSPPSAMKFSPARQANCASLPPNTA